MKIGTLTILTIFVFTTSFYGQKDSSQVNKKRLNIVLVSGTVLYAGSIITLSQAWYKDQGLGKFRFYNDNNQWNQVDKLGHVYTAYQISRVGTQTLKWANVSDKKAHIYGALMGILYQTPIEILDGFSNDYGASWGDLVSNTIGSGIWLGQHLLWQEERIHLKYSFHSTPYANARPELLGTNWTQQWLKDYNGQTYWLSFDIYSFTKNSFKFPKWLNIAIGYGAQSMVSANESSNELLGYRSYRQYYLSLDVDLSHIKTKNKILNSLLFIADMVKIPTPTVEFSQGKAQFHPLYF